MRAVIHPLLVLHSGDEARVNRVSGIRLRQYRQTAEHPLDLRPCMMKSSLRLQTVMGILVRHTIS